jgi:acetyltransferase
MAIRNLSFLLEPKSVALITDNREPSPLEAALAGNLVGAGFGVKLYAVGVKGGPFEGMMSYPDIPSLPEAPDLAILTTAPDRMPALLDRLGGRGTKAAVLVSPGQRDQERRSAILAAAKPHGMRIVGPGSMGIMTPPAALNASVAYEQPLKGNIAMVSQSGSVLTSVLGWATSKCIGFSHLIDLGDMLDVDFGDMLDYLANDMKTRAILLYMEEVTQVRKFMSAARLASRMKPVVVLKGGAHRDSLTCSILHGGETAGADGVYHAAFRRAGMIRAHDVRELFSAAESLARAKALPGERFAILSNGRGMGVLAADGLVDQGGCLAQLSTESLKRLNDLAPGWSHGNPANLPGNTSAERYTEALQILLADQGVDAVLLLHCSNGASPCIAAAREMLETLKINNLKSKFGRLLASWTGDKSGAEARCLFTDNSIAAYDTPLEAVSGFMQMVRYRHNQEMLMQTPPSIPGDFLPDTLRAGYIVEGALEEGRDLLSEAEIQVVFEAYGIHGLKPAESVSCAIQLITGVFNDAQFGPVIFFGQGGQAAEALEDLAFALPPLNMHLARDVIRRTRIHTLLKGRPGTEAADIDSIALLLVKVSQLICDIPRIAGLRIDPLLVDNHGLSIAGASMRVAKVVGPDRSRLIIAPYPKELEETIRLPDGQTLLLRPIRPEDEPAYVRLFERLRPEDIVKRFLHPMKMLPHSLAANLTQIDYDREMALVLIAENGSGETELLGGVRFSADPDNDRAEFAILLRPDVTGMGLGPMMMRKIIEAARRRGIKELYGDVLSENHTMLKLCKAFGFKSRLMPDDAGVVIVTLPL